MAMFLDAGVAGCAVQLALTVASSVSASSSSSHCVVGMNVRCLPVARGLRIGPSRAKFVSSAASQGSVRSQRRGVVCEAQETVTGGMFSVWLASVLVLAERELHASVLCDAEVIIRCFSSVEKDHFEWL